MKDESCDDTSAGVCYQTRVELVLDNQDQVGETKEEEEGDFDGSNGFIPELVTDAVEYDDDDDADDAETQDNVQCGEFVVTSYCNILCRIDAVVFELVQFSVDDSPIFSEIPVVLGPEVSLFSLALEFSVKIGVVVITFVNIGNIVSLVCHHALVVSHKKVFLTTKIDAWFIPVTWKTLRMRMCPEKLEHYIRIKWKLSHITKA